MIKVRNIYRDIPTRKGRPEEHIEEILSAKGARIERIVTYGRATPEGEWDDRDKNEFVFVAGGEVDFLFENGNQRVKMMKGDYTFIAAHTRHRVERIPNKKDTIRISVYF